MSTRTTMITEPNSNVFEQGVLVQFSVSIWGGMAKIPPAKMKTEASEDMTKGSKFLLDRSYFKPVEQVRNAARSYLRVHSLPFPVAGIFFIPKNMVIEVEQSLLRYQDDFQQETDCFIAQFENAKMLAQLKLNGLFNEKDYPDDMASKFGFRWQFFAMTAPGRMSMISPEMYEREQFRFQEMIRDFRENAVTVLRMRFSEMVDRIVERLSGEDKKFKNSTIGNLHAFLATFDELNINNDVELQREVARCKEILAGVDPNSLRSDAEFRRGVAKKMTEVQGQIDAMMENRPKRLLFMDSVEDEAKAA